MNGTVMWGGVLLLVGGLVHLFPGIYEWLTDLTGGGYPYVQGAVGLFSVVVALMLLGQKEAPKA